MKYAYGLIFLLSTSVLAEESFNIEDDFLKSLNQASQIATKSKLNRDKTTSLVSVLQGKKLQKLGVNDVYEALRYIPGIQTSKETSGAKTVIFRGSVTKGEVKFMIDGVEINNAYRASFYYFLDFPIELVSRIEVLRGPGSVLHGSGAISGVINIVTKSSQDPNSENELFLSAGSYNYTKGGTRLNLSTDEYKLSVDAYYQENDKEIDSSDQRFDDYSIGLSFKAYDFEFNARVKNSIQGNSYGLFNVKDTDENKYDNQNRTFFINLRHNSKISENNNLNTNLCYSKYGQRINANAGIDLTSDFKEESYCARVELVNSSITNNQFLIGAKAKHSHSLKTDLYGHPVESNIVSPNSERDIYSIYFNNNYLLTDSINISLGWRYDDYSDYGDNTSPDLGLVYRATEDISFKLKHAHAFRAPSWTELNGLSGNSNLKAEVSINTEFGVVYKHSSNTRLSLNTYHAVLEDYIVKVGSTYQQDSELNLRGAELDFSYTPKHNLEIGLISSYTEATDKDDNSVDYITNSLTTASLIYTFDYGLVFGSTLRYANNKNMDNDVIYDQSISYSYKDINFKLIGKNIFDSDTIYYDDNHDETNPIKDAGRLVLLKTSWTF